MSEAQKPSWMLNPKGHIWRLNEHGEVDCWVVDEGFHNGPGCSVCHFSFCEHCFNERDLEPCPGPPPPYVDPKDTRIAELKAQLAARDAELAEADRALIEYHTTLDNTEFRCHNLEEAAHSTYQAALAREQARKTEKP